MTLIVCYLFNMTLTLPDDPALAAFSPEQLRIELACALFAAGQVSRSVAARIAGMDRLEFDEELFRRRVPSYTEDMLMQDMAAAARRAAP
jgi:predicted HTH domain antitoxin